MGYSEVAEDQGKNKEIIDAERLFDQVPCEILCRGLAAHPEVYDHVEDEGEHDPKDAPPGGLFHAHTVGLPVKDAKIKGEHEKDSEVKQYPDHSAYISQADPLRFWSFPDRKFLAGTKKPSRAFGPREGLASGKISRP